jgi:MFS family permease
MIEDKEHTEYKAHSKDSVENLVPEDQRKKSLRASVYDACYYCGMAGIGESYFMPMMEALGASNKLVGLFGAIPQIGNALAQFIAIILIENIRLRKRIVLFTSSTQASMMGVMTLALLMYPGHLWVFIFIAFVYYAANGIGIPSWTSLLGDLTQGIERGKYFGNRNGIAMIILLIATLAGGRILQYFAGLSKPLLGFMVVMFIAMLCRGGSVWYLGQHYEVPYRKIEGAYFSFWDFIRRTPHSNFAKFTFLVAAMSLSVSVSGPYFAIYLLRYLQIPYFKYAIAMGIIVIMQYIMMKQWGLFADRFGNRIVLLINGYLLPILPLMWIGIKSFNGVIVVAVLGGLSWAGWAMSSGNFIFDAVSSEKRARCAAYLQVVNSIGVFLGCLLGVYLTSTDIEAIVIGNYRYDFYTPIQYCFLVSAVLRLLVMVIFMPLVREVREVEKPSTQDYILVFTNIRPFQGTRFERIQFSPKKLTALFKQRRNNNHR